MDVYEKCREQVATIIWKKTLKDLVHQILKQTNDNKRRKAAYVRDDVFTNARSPIMRNMERGIILSDERLF